MMTVLTTLNMSCSEGISMREVAHVGVDDDNDGSHMHITWVSCAHHMNIACTQFGYGMTLDGYDDNPCTN